MLALNYFPLFYIYLSYYLYRNIVSLLFRRLIQVNCVLSLERQKQPGKSKIKRKTTHIRRIRALNAHTEYVLRCLMYETGYVMGIGEKVERTQSIR